MNVGLNGFNASFSIASQLRNTGAQKSQSQQQDSSKPYYDPNYVHNSLGDFTRALYDYEDQWAAEYSKTYANMENGGKMTVEELQEYMKQEFSGYGVRFVDYNPKDVSQGQHLVYVDESHLQKMANDPEFRAQNMALMQREFAAQKGMAYRDWEGQARHTQLTGSVFSLSEENQKVDGSHYQGMAQGTPQFYSKSSESGGPTNVSGGKKGKSVAEVVAERQAELRERAKAKKKKEEAAARQEALEERQAERAEERKDAAAALREPTEEVGETLTSSYGPANAGVAGQAQVAGSGMDVTA